MAEILHEFTAGTKAKASEINDNFAFVRKEMVELNNETSSFLNEELRTFKEGIILDLEATAETKLNKDLSNIEKETVEKIVSYIMPDYKNGTTKSLKTTYTAEKDGIIVLSVKGNGGSDVDVEMYVDDVLINESDSWMRDSSQGWTCWGLVPKDSTYKVVSDFSGTLMFYPMKGAV